MAADKLAVILGSEGDGLAADTISDSDYTVRIPMAHGVDSLNVQAARESVIKMIRKNYPTEEIAFIVSSFSQDEIETVRREIAETE